MTTKVAPKEVRLWPNNPEARDFRVENLGRKYTSSVVQAGSDGAYVAKADKPEHAGPRTLSN